MKLQYNTWNFEVYKLW